MQKPELFDHYFEMGRSKQISICVSEHAKTLANNAAESRYATIAEFVEWAKEKEENNGEPEDNFQWNIGYDQALTDLLAFADSLKSNAPKV